MGDYAKLSGIVVLRQYSEENPAPFEVKLAEAKFRELLDQNLVQGDKPSSLDRDTLLFFSRPRINEKTVVQLREFLRLLLICGDEVQIHCDKGDFFMTEINLHIGVINFFERNSPHTHDYRSGYGFCMSDAEEEDTSEPTDEEVLQLWEDCWK